MLNGAKQKEKVTGSPFRGFRKWLLLCTLCIMAIPLLCTGAWAAEPANGTDDNIQWSIDTEGTLTISPKEGLVSAAMPDWKNDATRWDGKLTEITKAVIKDGVTSVGQRAFNNCSNLAQVEFPDSVTVISCC